MPKRNSTTKSHLTPQEWLSLYIRKQITIDCPEAEDLTWEESRPLSMPYKPQNDAETLEFNRLMANWQNIQYTKMDADLVILSALEQCQKAHDLLIFFLCNNHNFDFIENYLKRHQNPLSKDPIKTLLDNSWIEIDKLSHLFFLEIDDLGLLKDLWIVNKYALNDSSYLDDQKKIADILISAGGFNDTAKDQLAKEIVNRIMPEGDSPRLYNFASLETIEIGRRWARENSINWSCNEAERKELSAYGNKTKERIILSRRIEKYAKEHNLDLRQYLLELTRQLLDEGLFDSLKPFYGNNQRIKGWDKNATNYTGEKIYQEWQFNKKKAKDALQDLFDQGKFKKRLLKIDKEGNEVEVISARDLYEWNDHSKLAKDFKKQIAKQEVLGALIALWDADSFNNYRLTIKESIKTIEEASKQLGVDIDYKVKEIKRGIKSINELIDSINNYFDSLVFAKTAICDHPRTMGDFSVRIVISQIERIIL